ncbi:MAG: glycosyltransferase family 39 protein [Anaerolineales bacterium]
MKKPFLFQIYLFALILRLIPVLLTRNLGIGLDDMFQYDMLARSLAVRQGYRWYAQNDLKLLEPYVKFDLTTAKDYDPERGLYTSFRAPLYPTFLAIVYFLNGIDFSRFFAARLAQVIFLGAPLAPLTYLVSLQLFPDSEKTSKLSAWIVAAYPMLLVYPLGLGTENPFFVLLLAAFFFLLKSISQPKILNFLLSGVFLGLTALTRSVILPFAGLAIVYLFYVHRKPVMWVVIAFVLVVTPWILRNSLLHHKLTGIETSMGYNLYLGYHPKGDGSFVFGPSLDLLTIMDDAERDKVGTQLAIGFIKNQPERFVPLAVNRLGFFFGLEKRVLMYFYSNNLLGFIPRVGLILLSLVLLLPFVLVSSLSVFGFASVEWNARSYLLVILFVAYILPHVFILAEDRFHLALIPFMAILASYALVSVKSKRFQASKLVFGVSAVVMIFLFLNWGLELHHDADKIVSLFGPNGNQTYFPY